MATDPLPRSRPQSNQACPQADVHLELKGHCRGGCAQLPGPREPRAGPTDRDLQPFGVAATTERTG
eukprot:2327097-Alexandrium_andersonii.AAC.1